MLHELVIPRALKVESSASRPAARRLQRLLPAAAIAVAMASWLGLAANRVQAATISYTLTSLGGQDWQYSYIVGNDDGSPASLEEFTIYFGAGLYGNLQLTASPPGWDGLLIQPDDALPAAGFLDGLASGTGLSAGESLGGFSVSFTYLGSGTPGSQHYDIVDPLTFAVLASGSTALAVAPPPPPPPDGTVPEPGTLSMLSLAALMAVVRRGKRNAV
ncbi:MAG: PEP-CTERM sorting domain-containing protein [Rubrivivax sp.]